MTKTFDAVASRRGAAARRALLAAGFLAAGALPAAAADGIASFYGREHHRGPTASGERFDMNAMTAAHRSAPLGSRLKVTNLKNGRSVVVRINDRGPFVRGRIIDLSRAAAAELDFIGSGITRVRVETADAGTPTGAAGTTRLAALEPEVTASVPAPRKPAAHTDAKAEAEAEPKIAPGLDERETLLVARTSVD